MQLIFNHLANSQTKNVTRYSNSILPSLKKPFQHDEFVRFTAPGGPSSEQNNRGIKQEASPAPDEPSTQQDGVFKKGASPAKIKMKDDENALPPVTTESFLDAAANGRIEEVQRCLDSELWLDPELKAELGLRAAVENNQTEAAKIILEKISSDPSYRARLDMREDPFANATYYGYTDIVKAFLRESGGAEGRIGGNKEAVQSALNWSSGEGHLETVKELMQTNYGKLLGVRREALRWAAGGGKSDVLDELLKTPNIKKDKTKLRQAITSAETGGFNNIAERLKKYL